MTTQHELAERFRARHGGPTPLLLPNPWDAGSAKLFASLGFEALATTSSGFAATLGRLDGDITRDQALAHAAAIAAATPLPVSADLENGFADDPAGVAETVRGALAAGLAGCSIEDCPGRGQPQYEREHARARIEAAVEAAHAGDVNLVLTARAENFIRGNPDLADTITRLQEFAAAGADCVYAPGLTDIADIRAVVDAVDVPVNVLAVDGVPPVAELARAGVARVSVGGGLAYVAWGAVGAAARELREHGTYEWRTAAAEGAQLARNALKP